MIKYLEKICVIFFSVNLVGCSCYSQCENTTIGTVAGAVIGGVAGSAFGQGAGQAVAIGVGAVGGALAGGAIGHSMDHSMDSSDNTKMDCALDSPTYKATTWQNAKTGTEYTVVPTSNTMTVNGHENCRTYRTTASNNGQKQHSFGTACRKDTGGWETITKS